MFDILYLCLPLDFTQPKCKRSDSFKLNFKSYANKKKKKKNAMSNYRIAQGNFL
jgi:hypothetical protein